MFSVIRFRFLPLSTGHVSATGTIKLEVSRSSKLLGNRLSNAPWPFLPALEVDCRVFSSLVWGHSY